MQTIDAIARVAGGIAHDFNNLLTVIQGYAQLVAEKATDAKQASEIREVLQATDRASLLTDSCWRSAGSRCSIRSRST